MTNRFEEALMIQQGACNPSGIAHAIVKACAEARADGKVAGECSAVKLMVHQLAFICDVPTSEEYDDFVGWTKACEAKAVPQ